MKTSSYKRTLHFLCLKPELNYIHINQLKKRTAVPIHYITPNDLMCINKKHRNRILLVDHKQFDILLAEHPNLPVAWKYYETIVFNVGQRLTTEELINLGVLKGLFYRDEKQELIAQGLEAVIDGQNWLPRSVASQLLYHYRKITDGNSQPTTIDLTIRELEVLRCLQSGSSNTQIADDLFISEFTVKSHLYQIFKKLKVKNRTQAIAWANQNLLS
ncbi:response regulator transcription factor [Vibrio makurazakiensis]|uniref:LuxR C-terminal-related transcriptional regulator n=1 Tax=Vibrio makurazakiensis TaxID=2910250 RepID=UPI003D09CD91